MFDFFRTILRNWSYRRQRVEARTRRMQLGIPHYVHRNYQNYIWSFNWGHIVAHAKSAMGQKCEFCGSAAQAVHHVTYPRTRDMGLEDMSSLCVVCKRCHSVLHWDLEISGDTCALCGTSGDIRKLPAPMGHRGQHRPHVCKRCKSIATGFRNEAYQWPKEKYQKWITDWRESLFRVEVSRRRQ